MTRAAVLVAAVLLGGVAEGADPATQPSAAAEAARRAARIAAAIADLDSSDWIIQYRAVSQLVRWRAAEGAGPLTELLSGPAHPWVRGRALVALAHLRGAGVLDRAMSFTSSPHAELRAAAVEAIGAIGSARGASAVVAAVTDASPSVRGAAVLAAARLKGPAAWPLAAGLLKQTDAKLLARVATAMGVIGTPEARRELTGLLAHADADVRLAAARAVAPLRDPANVDALVKLAAGEDSAVRRKAAEEALAAYPTDLLHRRMLDVLGGENASHYAAAIRLLTVRPGRQASDAVARLVRKDAKRYASVLPAILELLAARRPDEYRDVFERALASTSSTVRYHAVKGLAECKGIDHFAVLKPHLADGSSSVRRAVLGAIERATTAAPPGGIVAWLAGVMKAGDWETQKRGLALIAARATADELAAGMDKLRPLLGGANEYYRAHAAKTLAAGRDEPTVRRLAAAQGYVTDWKVLGPLPNDGDNSGFAVVWPPEIAPAGPEFAKGCPEHIFGEGAVVRIIHDVSGPAKGMEIGPPTRGAGGRTIVTYALGVPPAKDAKLLASIAPADKDAKGAADVTVLAAGRKLWHGRLPDPNAPGRLELSLADHAGTTVALAFVVESVADANALTVLVRRPRVLAGGKTATDLARQAPTAARRIERAGSKPRQIAWRDVKVAGVSGTLALHDVFPPPTHYNVAYAAAELTSPAERTVVLEVAADDGCALWLNGRPIHRKAARHDEKVKAALRKGPNVLLVKVANLVDWWFFRLRVANEDGTAAGAVRSER